MKGLPNGIYKTSYPTASALEINSAIIYRRATEEKSCTEGKTNQQNLSQDEAKMLMPWITQLTATEHPGRHDFI